MANTSSPDGSTPIPLCAGCGRDSVSPDSCLCTLCTAHLATSTPIAWAEPTACVTSARTMAVPACTAPVRTLMVPAFTHLPVVAVA